MKKILSCFSELGGRYRHAGCRASLGALILCVSSHSLAATYLVTEEGCNIWDAQPVHGEAASWSGACVNGYAEGIGVVKWTAPNIPDSRSSGMFTAGKMNGEGFLDDAHGHFQGEFKDDLPNGKGVLRYPNGTIYTGTFVDGLPTHGLSVFVDGRIYEGDFVDDLWSGKGTLTWPNGDRYEGEFVIGQPTGAGVMTSSGVRQEGDFLNGKLVDPGVLAWRDAFTKKYWKAFLALPKLSRKEPTGRGWLQVWLDGNGRLVIWSVNKTSGWPELDQKVLQSVRSAGEMDRYPGKERLVYFPFSYGPGCNEFGTTIERDPAPLSPTGSRVAKDSVRSLAVPIDATYGGLTAAEKLAVKSQYERMADADEPPYPLNGTREILAAMAAIAGEHHADGDLKLIASINTDGSVEAVSVITSPDPKMTIFAARELTSVQFKPAVCNGAPCKMDYPFSITLKSR